MIVIKSLTWSNWFSFGTNNKIVFDDAKVIQIKGVNGSGKTSIPVILGEVLKGKNAFGKTKTKLFNRYVDNPALTAIITFEKDGVEYTIDYSRKSTLKLMLLEDGVDISSHSATNTLKTLDDILGFDFKLFWQLIYQSSTKGLEFLTATDTNRKKFLINLFNLDKYLVIHEQFKKLGTKVNNELLVVSGKLSTIELWIERHEKENLIPSTLEVVPEVSNANIDLLTDFKVQLTNIATTNKQVNDNNQYRGLLKNLDTSILAEEIQVPDKENLLAANRKDNKLDTELSALASSLINQLENISELSGKCPTCCQNINEDFVLGYRIKKQNKISEYANTREGLQEQVVARLKELKDIKRLEDRQTQKDSVSKDLQELLSKIDEKIPENVVDEEELKSNINTLSKRIENINESIKLITKKNLTVEAVNAKIKVIEEQLKEYNEQLGDLRISVYDLEFTINKINVIKKAFSTNGLLNYKIEFLVKDLEYQINTYLEELSSGRFQLEFALNGEKLDIAIIDDGKTIGIEELSAGELARINTATLLAIRKLMAAISSTKLNILFLDEIMGVLDEEGKEKLIDILNSEEDLNTFLVSHEFSHPLIPTINVVKENKISRIE